MNRFPYMVSVVVPCYNESKNIKRDVLSHLLVYFKHKSYRFEIIIVDDGSTDESSELLNTYVEKHPQYRLIKNSHQGKAASVLKGMEKAKGDIILFTDFDQATPIDQFDKLIPWFSGGYDVVIGSRSAHREGAPFFRLAMARGFMLLRRLILGLSGIEDTQCGFKVLRREVALAVVKRMKVFSKENTPSAFGSLVTAGFDVELLYIAKRLGYKIKEVPVLWHYVETRRVSPWRDSVQGVKDLLKIRLNSIQGKYD